MLQIMLKEVLQIEEYDTGRNLDLHKWIKSTEDGKYMVKQRYIFFFTFKISLEDNWLFKENKHVCRGL